MTDSFDADPAAIGRRYAAMLAFASNYGSVGSTGLMPALVLRLDTEFGAVAGSDVARAQVRRWLISTEDEFHRIGLRAYQVAEGLDVAAVSYTTDDRVAAAGYEAVGQDVPGGSTWA